MSDVTVERRLLDTAIDELTRCAEQCDCSDDCEYLLGLVDRLNEAIVDE